MDVTSNLAENIHVDYSKLRLLGRIDSKLYAMMSNFASGGGGGHSSRQLRQVARLIRCATEDEANQSEMLPHSRPHWPEWASIRTVPLPCPSLVVSHIHSVTLQLVLDVTSEHGLQVNVHHGDLGLLMGLNPKIKEMVAECVKGCRFSYSQVSYYSRCFYQPAMIPPELSGVQIEPAAINACEK